MHSGAFHLSATMDCWVPTYKQKVYRDTNYDSILSRTNGIYFGDSTRKYVLQLLPAYHNDDVILATDTNTSLHAISLSADKLDNISSFILDESVSVLPPYTEQILDAEYVSLLSAVYSQLYPDKVFSRLRPFIQRYGCITLFNDIIGSCLPGRNNRKSSVIMAYWPTSGDALRSIECTTLSVGIVQYFIKHTVSSIQTPESNFQDYEHVFAYVHWKQKHPQNNWFGTFAIVCVDIDEPLSPTCFIPVQRNACRCAYAVIPVDFDGTVESVLLLVLYL